MSDTYGSHHIRQAMESLLGVARRHPNVKLLLVFGSQARGDATTKSDLDVLYMSDGADRDIHSKISHPLRRCGQKYTLIPHDIIRLKKTMNLYGKMEYWAVRQGVITYTDDEYKKLWQTNIQRHVKHYTPATVHRCAPGWLAVACQYQASACRRGGRYDTLDDGFRHHMLYLAVDAAIKALLVHNGIMFPFVRDLNTLHGLLPDASVIGNVDEICKWNRASAGGLKKDTNTGRGSDFAKALACWQIINTTAHKLVCGKRTAVH